MNLKKILDEINNYYNDKNEKLIEFKLPNQINSLIDLDVNKNFETESDFINDLEKIIKYSVKTNHPYFLNQLFAGSDKYCSLGELVVSILNTSMYTYEVAPVFNTMETIIFNEVKKLFKFKEGVCFMYPGGSLSNITALQMCLYKYDNKIKMNGIYSQKKFKIFISKDAHYSWTKGCIFLGLGSNSVIKVNTINGQMDIKDLENKIINTLRNNNIPLMIIGTAGTTVFGLFDNILEISCIANKYNTWFHIDGALGGSLIFSKKYSYLLDGIDKVNSLTWNPHKMLNVPLQ